MVFVEFDVRRPLHLRPGIGGDDLGVVALGHIGQGLHLALHVHHHGVHGPGDDRQFLLEEVSGHRNPVAHQHLIGRAAHPRQVDPLGALGLGVGLDLRVLGGDDEEFRQQGFMAVHDQVHLVFFQHPEVDLSGDGLRGCRT